MMTNDGELLAAQARVQVIQAMLAHARKTCTPESFQDQAKGWLAEWQRLDEEIRAVHTGGTYPYDEHLTWKSYERVKELQCARAQEFKGIWHWLLRIAPP